MFYLTVPAVQAVSELTIEDSGSKWAININKDTLTPACLVSCIWPVTCIYTSPFRFFALHLCIEDW